MPNCVICNKPVASGYVLDDECLEKLQSLEAENKRLKAENDAAIEEIKSLLLYLNAFQCNLCKHHKSGDHCDSEYICVAPKSGGVPSGWEWHGIGGQS